MIHLRVRYIRGVAVVGVGEHAAGDPLPAGGIFEWVRAGGRPVVLDLSPDTVLSSAVLGHLISVMRAATAAKRTFRLCCPAGPDREVFAITKLDRLFPVFDTLAAALDGL